MFKKQASPKIICLIFAVLIVCFGLGFCIFAWTEPSADPPLSNVSLPLDVSNTDQTKLGSLTFPGFYDVDDNSYYVNPSGAVSAVLSGNVGIKTIAPNYELDVVGQANAAELCIVGDCRDSWPITGGSTKTIELIWDVDCDAELVWNPALGKWEVDLIEEEYICTATFIDGFLVNTDCPEP